MSSTTQDSVFFGPIGKWAIGLSTTGVLALFLWTFNTEGRVSGMEKVSEAHSDRLSGLESGHTTPMAAETRATFHAHDARMKALEKAVQDIRHDTREILLRLPPRTGAKGDQTTKPHGEVGG